MKTRKYTGLRISYQVNCSSSGDYYVNASLITKGGFRPVRFCINLKDGISQNGYDNLPKYAVAMIMDKLREAAGGGYLSVFEYDKHGSQRWEGLRYHDLIYFNSLLAAK